MLPIVVVAVVVAVSPLMSAGSHDTTALLSMAAWCMVMSVALAAVERDAETENRLEYAEFMTQLKAKYNMTDAEWKGLLGAQNPENENSPT